MKKLEKLAALVGIVAADITAEQLQEVNQELAANEINLEAVATGTVANLNEQINSLTGERDAATAKVTEHESTIQTLNARIAELEADAKSAGAEETAAKVGADVNGPEGGEEKAAHEVLSEEIRTKYGL